MSQEPDNKPGWYYVSMIDGARVARLAGPYVNDHAGALAAVETARAIAEQLDPRACWYAFGTCSADADLGPGVLNRLGKM